MKKSLSVKTIVAIGIGSAVFVILGRFVVIPTGFPNKNLETCYPFLALMSIVFGPIAGGLIGLIGHTLKDLTTYGSAWWSWIFCSGMIGMIYGFIGKKLSIQHGLFPKKELIYFSICQIIGNLIIWDGLAPTLDVLIYSEPANKVFTQGIIAVILNVLSMAIFGTLLLSTYAATRVKKGSLKKEW